MTASSSDSTPERIHFAQWTVLAQPVATRRAYWQLQVEEPKQCDCLTCRNFAAVGERAYPPEVHEILERLGINWRMAAEVAHCGRTEQGHCYMGWFHCIGELLEGPDAYVPTHPDGAQIILTPIGNDFAMGLSHKANMVAESFQGQPLLQLEFSAYVPWVLTGEGEPD